MRGNCSSEAVASLHGSLAAEAKIGLLAKGGKQEPSGINTMRVMGWLAQQLRLSVPSANQEGEAASHYANTKAGSKRALSQQSRVRGAARPYSYPV